MNVKIAFEDKKRISSRCYSNIRIYIRKSTSIYYYVEKEEVLVLLLFSCLVETKGNKLHLCAFYFSTREVANFVAFKTSLEESLDHKTRQYIRVKKQDTIENYSFILLERTKNACFLSFQGIFRSFRMDSKH